MCTKLLVTTITDDFMKRVKNLEYAFEKSNVLQFINTMEPMAIYNLFGFTLDTLEDAEQIISLVQGFDDDGYVGIISIYRDGRNILRISLVNEQEKSIEVKYLMQILMAKKKATDYFRNNVVKLEKLNEDYSTQLIKSFKLNDDVIELLKRKYNT